jgi:hypothetical protein
MKLDSGRPVDSRSEIGNPPIPLLYFRVVVDGPPTNCDDGDPCTLDTCAGGGCAHDNTLCGACCLPAGPCADGVTPEECSSILAYGGVFQGLGSVCLGDADDDGLDDLCDTDNIPTVSEWGLVIMTLLYFC